MVNDVNGFSQACDTYVCLQAAIKKVMADKIHGDSQTGGCAPSASPEVKELCGPF